VFSLRLLSCVSMHIYSGVYVGVSLCSFIALPFVCVCVCVCEASFCPVHWTSKQINKQKTGKKKEN
jgi:hypothetical protein